MTPVARLLGSAAGAGEGGEAAGTKRHGSWRHADDGAGPAAGGSFFSADGVMVVVVAGRKVKSILNARGWIGRPVGSRPGQLEPGDDVGRRCRYQCAPLG